jgi:hypothetical protein
MLSTHHSSLFFLIPFRSLMNQMVAVRKSGLTKTTALHIKSNEEFREAVSEPEVVATGSALARKHPSFAVNHRFS